jgi:uncharacterized membrane protein
VNFFIKLRGYLFAGLVFLAPTALTIYLLYWMTITVDRLVQSLVPSQYLWVEELFLIPGIGVLISLIVLILLGVLLQNVVGNYFVNKWERLFSKLPLVRTIFITIKQVVDAFFGKNAMSFREVALVEYPRKDLWALCFVTGTTQGEVQEKTSDDVINVFLPTTPNPTSGFLLFVPRQDLHILDMTVEQGIKMIISAGIITPDYKRKKKLEIKKDAQTKPLN